MIVNLSGIKKDAAPIGVGAMGLIGSSACRQFT